MPADQSIRELMIKPLHHDVGYMWSCLFLLEQLHISIHTMSCSMCSPELVQHINVTLFCDSDCLLIYIFKPKQSDYSIFQDGHPGRAFHSVQRPLKYLIWGFCTPVRKVGNLSRGWTGGRALLLSLDCSTLPLILTL